MHTTADERFNQYKQDKNESPIAHRSPVHVVYGGADRYSSATPAKLGAIALKTVAEYAPNAADFAASMGLDTTDESPSTLDTARVYELSLEKLRREPVEDFRIDFEDGYGFRSNDEEDGHARLAAAELALAYIDDTITPFCGFRIKSLAEETGFRAERTLRIFLEELLNKTSGALPNNFVITLPKVSDRKEVNRLIDLLEKFEDSAKLEEGSIGVELMIETPQAIFDHKGRLAIARLVKAAKGRCTSAHFGAYDYTASLGIAAQYQGLDHPSADLARQFMLIALAPMEMRLSDSVTTQIPVPVHRGENLTDEQKEENRTAISEAWQIHYRNVTRSMANGFYQSWDLHPNQLPARYAAVYSFFLRRFDEQARRLQGFIEKATKASVTGTTFDDAASARRLVTFFERGVGCGAFTEEEVEIRMGRRTVGLQGLFGHN